MIIDPETGTIISKGDKFNGRHLWNRYDLTTWHCIKCQCEKKQTGEKEYTYYIDKDIFNKAPICTNSKLTIIKLEKNGRKKDEQLRLFE